MLDLKRIRQDTEKVKTAMKNRQKDIDIDQILAVDDNRREIIFETDNMKAEQNKVSKLIPVYKKEGKDTKEIFEQMKVLSDNIKANEAIIRQIAEQLNKLIMVMPNIPNDRVPVGVDSDDNVEISRFGEPRNFSFEPLPHWEIGKALNILDAETAAKVTGARFHFYKGLGAKLERALINFFLDYHSKKGYLEVFPPFIVNRASMTGTGQLPKFEEDAFKLSNTDYFLIPTAEVPITNMHRQEILDFNALPIKYCAYSACFRAEAGSAGRDTRGLIRQHQFNKVELVKFTNPETSYEELESLTIDAQGVLKTLGIPYRVMLLCTGDLGFSSAFTYDIEVWMPSYKKYVEISSCSNFEDFQARRAEIRYKKNIKDKTTFVHTLNGSGVAVGRTVACILENFQNADGTITVPEVLRPYMGVDFIK